MPQILINIAKIINKCIAERIIQYLYFFFAKGAVFLEPGEDGLFGFAFSGFFDAGFDGFGLRRSTDWPFGFGDFDDVWLWDFESWRDWLISF